MNNGRPTRVVLAIPYGGDHTDADHVLLEDGSVVDGSGRLIKRADGTPVEHSDHRDAPTRGTNEPNGSARSLLAGMRDGAWLDHQHFDPLQYAIPGVVPEGLTLLVGPPKIGKSWFVLALALACASGGRVLGSVQVQQRPTLYLALEDGDRRLQSRCRLLLGDDPIPPGFNYLIRLVRPNAVLDTIGEYLAAAGDQSPLIILDTLGKVMPTAAQGESAYQRDYRVGGALKALADEYAGTALLVNHHDRKATSDDFVESVSGTNGLAGSADTIIVLNRHRQQPDGQLLVTGRDVHEGEYAVRLTEGGIWLAEGGDLEAAAQHAVTRRATANLSDRSVDVFAEVQRHPGGVSPSEIAAALGLDSHSVGTYLGRLAGGERPRIRKLGRGRYAPLPPSTGVETVVSVEAGEGLPS